MAASPLDSLAGAPLNHLLRANAWARDTLKPHAGKTLCLRCMPFAASLTVLDSGEVTAALPQAAAAATLTLTPGLLLRMASGDDSAWRDVAVEGDTALVNAVNHLWRHLRWDAGEDLSKLFGDVIAQRMTASAQTLGRWAHMSGDNLARAAAEYWTEEQPLVAAAGDIARFSAEVDVLRDDLARLEKRIAGLAAAR